MFHCDHGTRIPWPWTVAQHANMTWVLTDYTRDNYTDRVVPGSDRLGHSVPDVS